MEYSRGIFVLSANLLYLMFGNVNGFSHQIISFLGAHVSPSVPHKHRYCSMNRQALSAFMDDVAYTSSSDSVSDSNSYSNDYVSGSPRRNHRRKVPCNNWFKNGSSSHSLLPGSSRIGVNQAGLMQRHIYGPSLRKPHRRRKRSIKQVGVGSSSASSDDHFDASYSETDVASDNSSASYSSASSTDSDSGVEILPRLPRDYSKRPFTVFGTGENDYGYRGSKLRKLNKKYLRYKQALTEALLANSRRHYYSDTESSDIDTTDSGSDKDSRPGVPSRSSRVGDETISSTGYMDEIDAGRGIRNFQTDVPVDLGLLERHLQIIKDIMGLRKANIEVELVNKNLIRDLNLSYLGKNKSTDILSFSYDLTNPLVSEEASIGNVFSVAFRMPMNTAFVQERCDEDRIEMENRILNNTVEIVDYSNTDDKGVSRIMSQAFTVQERLPLLLIHGVLHLLRYDHESSSDYGEMARKEESIAAEFFRRSQEFRPCYNGHYVIGVGADMCYIPRIRKVLEEKEEKLVNRICSAREKQLYFRLKQKYMDESKIVPKGKPWLELAAPYLAKRFATKEAVAKALGTGLRHVSPGGISLRDIQVWSRTSGQPTVELLGKGRDVQHALGISRIIVSQTDEKDNALSFATACGSTSDNTIGDFDWEVRYGSFD